MIIRLLSLLSLAAVAAAGPLAPIDLRVNNLPLDGKYPITLDPNSRAGLKLEWTPVHTERGAAQVAYQVQLTETLQDSSVTVHHDSGVVKSASPRHEFPTPASLTPGARLSVSVSFFDADGVRSARATSPVDSVLVVGPTDSVWDQTQWIGVHSGMFRKQVTVSADQLASGASMTAFVAGIGYHQLYVNGKRVGSDALAGSWTTYNARVLYNTYDVSTYLVAGDNTIGVLLGHGWRDTSRFNVKYDADPTCDAYERLLRVAVTDGSGNLVAKSDTTWSASAGGPITMDSVYDGETYDARLEEPGWSTNGYKPVHAKWAPATAPTCFKPIMTPLSIAPIAQAKTNAAVSVTRLDSNTQVVDFGENLSGWTRMSVAGPAGTTVSLRHAEVLMHPPYGPTNGSVYTGNLRSAKATDTYTLKGDAGGEIYEPHFTYHGYRYVSVEGYPGDLHPDNVTQIHFRTMNKLQTTFQSSSDIVNRIQTAAAGGQGSNMMSVPTDCDQRDERLGWMGDAGLSAETMAINYDDAAFQENHVRIMLDDQPAAGAANAGALPDTVPFMRYGNEPADPSWSAAFCENLYTLFTINKNTAPVKMYWSNLMLYFQNIAAQVKTSGGLKTFHATYGDWVPASAKVSNSLPAAMNYVVNVAQAIEMGKAIGEDVSALTTLHSQLLQEFNSAFRTSSAAAPCWDQCIQGGWSMAFAAGAVSASNMTAVTNALVNDIAKTNGNHVTGGIITVKAMFPALEAMKQHSTALTLAEQTSQPSWGYMLTNTLEPATTSIWELWKAPQTGPGMNSRNHHMFSSISTWIVRSVGGTGDSFPSCSRDEPLSFFPAKHTGVSRATTTIDAACGAVKLSYTRHGGMQCVRHPETRSSVAPMGITGKPAVVDCGTRGGVITGIEFASFGTATGSCGQLEVDSKCHAPASQSVLESLCVGKQACSIPTDADFWMARGGAPASCTTDNEARTLAVQAVCSAPHSLEASVTVPVGTAMDVTLPTYGTKGLQVTETVSGQVVFGETATSSLPAGVLTTSADDDSVRVRVQGGDFKFVMA